MAQARFYDGVNAAAITVRLGFGHDALLIQHTATHQTLAQWPYRTIQLLETPAIGHDYILTAKGAPDERLVFTDKALYEQIYAHGNLKVPNAIFFDLSLTKLAVCMAIAAIVGVGIYTSLPAISSAFAKLVPEFLEVELANIVEREMAGNFRTCEHPEGQKALDKLVATLHTASGNPLPADVKVVNAPVVNAFAIPARRILIFSRLIDRATSPDQLAGVLAHEMGHVRFNHPLQGVMQELGLRAMFSLAFSGSGGEEYMSTVSRTLVSTSYTRAIERAADDAAVKTLKKAGLPLTPFAEFFSLAEIKSDSTALQYVSTHPMSSERIHHITKQTDGYKATRTALTDEEWNALKRICR